MLGHGGYTEERLNQFCLDGVHIQHTFDLDAVTLLVEIVLESGRAGGILHFKHYLVIMLGDGGRVSLEIIVKNASFNELRETVRHLVIEYSDGKECFVSHQAQDVLELEFVAREHNLGLHQLSIILVSERR